MIKTETGLAQKQITAIKLSCEVGRKLQGDLPEIADDWRKGLTREQIVRKYDITGKYGLSFNVASTSIIQALHGTDGHFGVDAYEGLLTAEELERIFAEHKTAQGKRLARERKGLFSASLEQRVLRSKKAGLTAVEKKVGVHALTSEQHRENCLKGLAVVGKIPWVQGEDPSGNFSWIPEKEFAYRLGQLPEYQHQGGGARHGKMKCVEVAEVLNRLYHGGRPVRNREAVASTMKDYRKVRESKS